MLLSLLDRYACYVEDKLLKASSAYLEFKTIIWTGKFDSFQKKCNCSNASNEFCPTMLI